MIVLLLLLIIFLVIVYKYKIVENFSPLFSSNDRYILNTNVVLNESSSKSNIGIGIGKEASSDYLLDVKGTLHVKDKFCFGDVCLTQPLIDKLNDLPVYNKDKLCLSDNNNREVCITKDHLKILNGQRHIQFKNEKSGDKLQRQDLYAYPTHDDGHDGSFPHCRWNRDGLCSFIYTPYRSSCRYGYFKGFTVNRVNEPRNGARGDDSCVGVDRNWKNWNIHRYSDEETKDYTMIPNSKRINEYGSLDRKKCGLPKTGYVDKTKEYQCY